CNSKCVFCPRGDSEKYPNQDLKMSLDLIRKMAGELKSYDFSGIVNICGYGEPLLYKDIVKAVAILSEHGVHTEIVTNGDKLNEKIAQELKDAGLRKLIVSMYDGPQQIEKFKAMLASTGEDFFVLRDRWHDETKDYGLILTNRGGVMPVNRPNAFLDSPCFYTHYSMTIDWNGDALLCVQDWNKKVKMGNLWGQSLFEVWSSNLWNKYRSNLTQGKRDKLDPCRTCDARGVLIGKNHSQAWSTLKKSPGAPANLTTASASASI
ncbi:MAG: radical SAM/SPASM domain-containing protein, partial [Bdellovibrionota bacterium]